MKTNVVSKLLVAAMLALPFTAPAANNTVLGWNNLGMHCMDSDYSVFSVLPPYNTIEAQLIVAGKLVTNGTYTVTYQAVTDPDGSINSTSIGKGNFATFESALYGPSLAPDMGLAGWGMPGAANVPQGMLFEATNHPAPGVATPVNWFRAEGIPLTPYDDAGNKNPYPLMRLIARSNGTAIATNDIVLPVSDEMDCRACHASGSTDAAKPAAGWVWSSEPERDFRLNILRLHDEREFAQHNGLYTAALAARGFNPQGLYRGVVADGKPVLCAICHASEALGLGSFSNTPPLTASVHMHHASVMDPQLNMTLNSSANRAACYRCHPGSTTKCLRGAMGSAIASDGSMSMQCQSCHGSMSQVGSPNRVGWFMEPNCQGCHTGTATSNSGQIRFTSVFTDTNGTVRVPANNTFATQPNTPAPGISLFRFSAGHGGLQCEACHGSTHAEFPSTHRNDNVRNIALQGHAGMMVECTACHTATPTNYVGGPHGMHPVGAAWVSAHPNFTEQNGSSQCRACHGTDYRGTVLSKMQADRTLSAFGTNTFFRGAIVGCYTCHNGPSNDHGNTNAAPVVSNISTNTLSGQSVAMTLPVVGSGANALITSQPAHGSVGLSNRIATYFPDPGYVGTDTFTFAAYDGSKNSLQATGSISVAQGPFTITAQAHVPATIPANWPAAFTVVAVPGNIVAPVSYDWNFGDGSVHATTANPSHSYPLPGNYNWSVIARVQSGGITASATNSGVINVTAPVVVSAVSSGSAITLSWPQLLGDSVLEVSDTLSPAQWKPATNVVASSGGAVTVSLNSSGLNQFFRLRQVK